MKNVLNENLFSDGIHPDDMERIKLDKWLNNFLFNHDYNVKEALKQCWDTLEWRKKFGVNGMLFNE